MSQKNSSDRFFSPDLTIRKLARDLFASVNELPIISPHGHVNPAIFSDADAHFGSPVDLLIIPDHYITRLLHSQGVPLEELGLSRRDSLSSVPDHRHIWKIFCDKFHLFRGTPSGIWLQLELEGVFGLDQKPTPQNADWMYDQLTEMLGSPDFSPRALFERFHIEILCTTDASTDMLQHHRAIRDSGWNGKIYPTFRPDGVIKLDDPNWLENINLLSEASGISISDFDSFIKALEERRLFFKSMGALASDHDVLTPFTMELTCTEANQIFRRALKGDLLKDDVQQFRAHMLMEMARMSCEDGLVMQLHCGSWRNHSQLVYHDFGIDRGADIPIQAEFTRNLFALLNQYGNDPRFNLIVFTLDESTYARELAPLAGFYPALKLGPPWWFHDSLNGIARYFDQVSETAGLYNTAGFNDDTRAFCSIPARHEVWRRSSANWLAELQARGIIDRNDAEEMMYELAVGLAKRAYKIQT